ncbi:hypothetical protein AWENTII_005441 [Aspergillus wentii]
MADSGDRMFCHACEGVWLRNESGLTCPHCQSDFTEIVEIPPESPEETSHAGLSTPPHRERSRSPINPWANHDPWANEDDYLDDPHGFGSGLGNGYSHRTYRSPDGRFTFTSTMFGGQSFPPRRPPGFEREMPGDPLMPMMRSLETIFNGLAETRRNQDRTETPRQDSTEPDERPRDMPPEFGATGRLFPRDTNGPQNMAPPLSTLGDILDLLRPDPAMNAPGGGGAPRVMTGPNPMAMLSTLLNLTRHGDAVYSQEELDRVVSQLVDQTSSGTAPRQPPRMLFGRCRRKRLTKRCWVLKAKRNVQFVWTLWIWAPRSQSCLANTGFTLAALKCGCISITHVLNAAAASTLQLSESSLSLPGLSQVSCSGLLIDCITDRKEAVRIPWLLLIVLSLLLPIAVHPAQYLSTVAAHHCSDNASTLTSPNPMNQIADDLTGVKVTVGA